MKNIIRISFLLLAIFLVSCNTEKANQVSNEQLASGFKNTPDSILTSIYWYWVGDQISEEGIIKDLHAMQKVGINRAYIGNIDMYGIDIQGEKVLFGTDEWWKMIHTALKTATELNIEIGLFNSPG